LGLRSPTKQSKVTRSMYKISLLNNHLYRICVGKQS